MNKAVLTASMMAAFMAGNATAATVYQDDTYELKVGGRAEARFNISDENETTTQSAFEDKTRARLSIQGKSKLSSDLIAFGKYEEEINTDGEHKTRYIYAGLDTSIGAFSYGKQDSAQVMLTDYTDIMATFGGEGGDLIQGNKDKLDNVFLYQQDMGAITLAANYTAKDQKDSDNYGLAVQYATEMGLNLGLGYVDGKEANVSADQANVAISYSLGDLYLAGLYVMGALGEVDLIGYEVAAAYQVGSFAIQGTYNYQESENAGITTEQANAFALEGVYKLNGHLRGYAGYLFDQRDGKDDQLQAGLRFDF